MSKITLATSSPVFIRQKINTTAKQNRLRRISKRKHDSEKYFARSMVKSDCKIQRRLTSTGGSCVSMSNASPAIIYLNSTGAHKQFFAR